MAAATPLCLLVKLGLSYLSVLFHHSSKPRLSPFILRRSKSVDIHSRLTWLIATWFAGGQSRGWRFAFKGGRHLRRGIGAKQVLAFSKVNDVGDDPK